MNLGILCAFSRHIPQVFLVYHSLAITAHVFHAHCMCGLSKNAHVAVYNCVITLISNDVLFRRLQPQVRRGLLPIIMVPDGDIVCVALICRFKI